MHHILPIQTLVRKHFDYNPDTGELPWKMWTDPRHCNPIPNPKNAGKISQFGYRRLRFMKKEYMAHRIIWMWWYGQDPGADEIDHINHDKADNRITNLRRTTNNFQNAQNTPKKTCYAGQPLQNNHTGVYQYGGNKPYVSIQAYGKKIYLGTFETVADAIKAHEDAIIYYHGEYARLDSTNNGVNK
jgi:hypothetical protein